MNTLIQTYHTMDTQTPNTPGKQCPHRLSAYLRRIVCLAAILACAPCSTYAEQGTPSPDELISQFKQGSKYYKNSETRSQGEALIQEAISQGVGKALEKAKDAKAMYELGVYYEYTANDEKQAVQWYRKAAGTGDPDGMRGLAECYRDGIGIEKDVTKAVEWYCKAADKSTLKTSLYAKELKKLAPEKAVQCLRKAAEVGSLDSMCDLAECYRDGIGVERDVEQAKQWLQRAAGIGFPPAMFLLGRFYDDIEKDEKQAKQWLHKAADTGYTPAKELLQKLKQK